MERKIFWNEAAKCGAVLGVLLAVSFVLENLMTTSGRMGLYYLMILEWVAVVGLHFWLLLRFTRKCSAAYSAEAGFTFGQGYGCVLAASVFAGVIVGVVQAASVFAGVIVGVVQAVYLHLIVGYANYVERTIAAMTELMAQSGSQMPASMEGLLAQSFAQMRTAPVPSVLQSVWGGFFSTLLFGLVFGLIIAAVVSRAPRPFDKTNDDTAE